MIRQFSLRLRLLLLLPLLLFLLPTEGVAQQPHYGKMSAWVRQIVKGEEGRMEGKGARREASDVAAALPSSASLCAFVRLEGDAEAVMARHGMRSLAHWGNIHIADIPLSRLAALSCEPQVLRIEAKQSHSLCNDSCAVYLRTLPAWQGYSLPQPYTGQGVVVGVMDVGFDLTHPTFYAADMQRYRIHRFWDQLSADTLASSLYVGRDWTTSEEILAQAHSTDGSMLSHGTHTLATAAGSGYTSPYRGMAPDADLCVVANAVSNNIGLVDSTQIYKFTYATDALGFKYMFDYAQSVGKPCVISFSEGSAQDFRGDDVLFYEVLDSLTGPGRIIVAAAGNDALLPTYIHKPHRQQRAGNFLFAHGQRVMFTAKSRDPFGIDITFYHDATTTESPRTLWQVHTREVLAKSDSTLTDTVHTANRQHTIAIAAFPSCYNSEEMCYEVVIGCDSNAIGVTQPLSVELTGSNADVELFKQAGYISPHPINPSLNDGEATHCINSPASAPSVISVGATGYRKGAYNYKGEWGETDYATGGLRSYYSSVGPTFDGRLKPDVTAPGSNVISAYSSYYIEAHPEARDVLEDVEHFDYGGRTYAWNRNSGTSMACPAAAGVVALWLQACPTLSPADVLDIIAHTSQHNDPVLSYPNQQYGYGQIDAYAGLLYLLSSTAIPSLPVNPTRAQISITPDATLHIILPHTPTQPTTLTIYTTQGVKCLTITLPAQQREHRISLAQLPRGIYALQFDGNAETVGAALFRW